MQDDYFLVILLQFIETIIGTPVSPEQGVCGKPRLSNTESSLLNHTAWKSSFLTLWKSLTSTGIKDKNELILSESPAEHKNPLTSKPCVSTVGFEAEHFNLYHHSTRAPRKH